MFSVIAFVVVLQSTVSILCEQTVTNSTASYTPSTFSALLQYFVFKIRSELKNFNSSQSYARAI